MESIKHKMECLVKEKDDAIKRADQGETEGAQFEAEAIRYEKEVDKVCYGFGGRRLQSLRLQYPKATAQNSQTFYRK